MYSTTRQNDDGKWEVIWVMDYDKPNDIIVSDEKFDDPRTAGNFMMKNILPPQALENTQDNTLPYSNVEMLDRDNDASYTVS